jgi:methylated-DNA-protein-cysteine methyltransferase-like protein
MSRLPEDFYQRVYAVVREIPPGRATSYGAIARVLGADGAARTVGYAMNASHSDPTVPAHRVVNRNGLLTGKFHFGSLHAMQQHLEAEGVQVENDAIQDWDRVFWDPADARKIATNPLLP